MRFDVRVTGGDQLRATLHRLGNQGPVVLGDALYRWGEMVMADSKANYVPVDTGQLRASGHVKPPEVGVDQVTVEFGYGGAAAPYALATHENPRAGKTGGVSPSGRKYKHWAKVGEWKFLETPFKKHAGRLQLYVAQALNRAIARARKAI